VDFFRVTTFQPLGVLARQIFTCARDWPRLASACHKPGWGPPRNFKSEHLKFGLKIQLGRAYNFAVSGSNLTKLYQAMCLKADVIMRVQLLEGPSTRKFGRAKNVKNSARFSNLARFLTTFNFDHEYLQNGSTKIWKACDQLQPLPRWAKMLANFGPLTKKLYECMLTHPSGLFSEHYISALSNNSGCHPRKFLQVLQPLDCLSSRTCSTGQPQVGLCPIFLVLFSRFLFKCDYLCWPER